MGNEIVLEPPSLAPQVGLPPIADDPSADDWVWMHTERSKPDGGVFGLYQGLYVAVHGRQVVGACAPNSGRAVPLTREVAERFGVPEERVVLVYIDGPQDFFAR